VLKSVLFTMVGLAALAAGCAKNDEAVRPVSWYLQHEPEARAKVVWCIDDAERQRTADCANAIEAKRRLQVGSQKALAPIDWGAAKTPQQ
jgi:hypothetical protein